jgi:hypothetical protein
MPRVAPAPRIELMEALHKSNTPVSVDVADVSTQEMRMDIALKAANATLVFLWTACGLSIAWNRER